ncbi:MAG: hypothetical protein ACRC8Y_10590, partial [Chroococcales cyanobacterium]
DFFSPALEDMVSFFIVKGGSILGYLIDSSQRIAQSNQIRKPLTPVIQNRSATSVKYLGVSPSDF